MALDRRALRAAPPLWCLAAGVIWASAAHAEPPPARSPIAITDVAIVDVERGGTIGPRTVVIDGGRIAAITAPADARIPPGARRIAGDGRFLIPGLVDLHVHLFNRASRRPPNDWAFPLFVAAGVTAVRDMNTGIADLAQVARWRAAVERGDLVAPRIVAAGTAVHGRSPRDAADQVAAAAAAGADFIKIYSEVPEAHWRAIRQAAAARRLPVVGHAPAGVPLRDAAGLRSDEHLMQAYEACSSIEAELIDARRGLADAARVALRDEQELRALDAFDAATCERVAAAIAATGQVHVPTLVLDHAEFLGLPGAPSAAEPAEAQTRGNGEPPGPPAARARPGEEPPGLPATRVRPGEEPPGLPAARVRPGEAATAPVRLDDDPRWRTVRLDERARWQRILAGVTPRDVALGERRARVGRRIVAAFHRAGVPILAGTDAPMPRVYPGGSLHDELALLVDAGLSPLDALRAATLGPARFLGLAATTGSIAVGKRADLVLLDADPTRDIRNTQRIAAVVLDGRLLPRAALDALIADAARGQSP
jgi:cytosine/adenosine deaminase-related metal-dependent hydrolase